MHKKNQWIIRHGDKWAVKGEGNKRATKITETQKEAINIGKRIAKNQKS
jgi:hypothetical protein